MTHSHTIFKSVSLDRGGVRVLDGISLSLSEKRIALVGLNGSGKSSFLRLLNGLLIPDKGHVEIDGVETTDQKKELSRKVGFLFQNPDHQIIFPTVIEELCFGLRQFGASRAEAETRSRDALTRLDCEHWADQPTSTLSEGQKQLVCLTAVSLLDPRILVFDEPFSSLDLATRHFMEERIRAAAQVVYLVSHEIDLIMEFERVIWLDDGVIAGDGPPHKVMPEYRAFARHKAQALRAADL